MSKVRYVIQYRSVKGNCEEWRHVWNTPEEWQPCWADSDGHIFDNVDSARRNLSSILARNPDFPHDEWRIIRRVTTENPVD